MKLKLRAPSLPKIDLSRLRCMVGKHKWQPVQVIRSYGKIGGPCQGVLSKCDCGKYRM